MTDRMPTPTVDEIMKSLGDLDIDKLLYVLVKCRAQPELQHAKNAITKAIVMGYLVGKVEQL